MSYPDFPTALPPPLIAGYQHQRGNARRLTTFDSGPPKSSLRHGMVPRTISLRFRLSSWQVHTFNRFYEDACRWGTVMFWLRDHMVDGAPLLTSDGRPRLNSQGVPLLASRVMLCAWGDEPPVFSDPLLGRQSVTFQVVEMPG